MGQPSQSNPGTIKSICPKSSNKKQAQPSTDLHQRGEVRRLRLRLKMESELQAVCKFHQSGHCKFRSSCKHFHTHDTCFDSHCDQKSCTARHPLPCKYFFQLGFCRFGTTCSYKHSVSPLQDNLANTVNNIKDEIELVKAMLQTKDMEIKNLEDKVTTLQIKIVSNKKYLKSQSPREHNVEELLEDSSTPLRCEECS